jgi:hypothetical protein
MHGHMNVKKSDRSYYTSVVIRSSCGIEYKFCSAVDANGHLIGKKILPSSGNKSTFGRIVYYIVQVDRWSYSVSEECAASIFSVEAVLSFWYNTL